MIRIKIGKQAAVFKARVGINDHIFHVGGVADFEVVGDGRRLWRSGLLCRGLPRECEVDVSGVDILELLVHALGSNEGLHVVWIEPRLLQRADTPD